MVAFQERGRSPNRQGGFWGRAPHALQPPHPSPPSLSCVTPARRPGESSTRSRKSSAGLRGLRGSQKQSPAWMSLPRVPVGREQPWWEGRKRAGEPRSWSWQLRGVRRGSWLAPFSHSRLPPWSICERQRRGSTGATWDATGGRQQQATREAFPGAQILRRGRPNLQASTPALAAVPGEGRALVGGDSLRAELLCFRLSTAFSSPVT